MKFIEKISAEEYDFPVNPSGKKEQQFKCPVCSKSRKQKNQNKKIVSINTDKMVGTCFHCGVAFLEKKEYKPERKVYIKPTWNNNTDLPDEVVKWFKNDRKISQDTLIKARVTKGTAFIPALAKVAGTIDFNYFRNGELTYIKHRTRDKDFAAAKDAEPILYNLDGILGQEEVIITEGEMDVLSYMEVGFENVCSFPNGANDKNSIDRNIGLFDNAKKIYLAVDQDYPGIMFREELRRRLGTERCFRVDFKDKKDANEYLVRYGKEKLKRTIQEADEFPIEGLVSALDYEAEIQNLYDNGIDPGLGIRHKVLNRLITFETGRLCTVTGIPGHGKSEFVDEICESLNTLHGWKTVYFSPENWPIPYHVRKLVERLSGDPMVGYGKMSQEALNKALEYVSENFKFIIPKDDKYSLEAILDKARQAIHKHGCKVVVLDPWNRVEHQLDKNETETNYISRQLSAISNFAQKNDILFILVAHPRKVAYAKGQYDVPNLYDIAGSANFYNKTDFGLTVYRDKIGDTVQVHVQKVKFRHLGKPGVARFLFNSRNARYHPLDIDQGKNGELLFDREEEEKRFDNSNHMGEPEDETPQSEMNFEITPNEIYDGSTRTDKPPF